MGEGAARAVVLGVVVLLVAVAGSSLVRTPSSPAVSPSAAVSAYFDYLVIILLENHGICEILTSCGGSAPYLTSLANAYGYASQYRYCGVNPSLPNYLCLTGGSDFGCSGYDGDPQSNACTSEAWNATNIMDHLEGASLTWKAYMEDMPSNCYGSNSGLYAVRHNPFVYYKDIATNPARCARIVPSGSGASVLVSDLASTSTASNYMWFTPNTCNDMHDSNCGVGTGDAYLATLVPKILNSNVFQTQNAALFITFDEDHGGAVLAQWAGRGIKTGFVSSSPYTHFSLLSTIEANWNLGPLTTNDQNAPKMAEFFSGQPGGGNYQPPTAPFPLALVLLGGFGIFLGVIVVLLVRRLRGTRSDRPPRRPREPEEPGGETDFESDL